MESSLHFRVKSAIGRVASYGTKQSTKSAKANWNNFDVCILDWYLSMSVRSVADVTVRAIVRYRAVALTNLQENLKMN